MEEYIHHSLTLESWMDRELEGESVSQRDLEIIATYDSEQKVRIISHRFLNEEERKKWWGHVRDKFMHEVIIEYSNDQKDYQKFKQLWVEDYDKQKAIFDSLRPKI